jgi:ferredoxin
MPGAAGATKNLRDKARELLESGKVKYIIGYRESPVFFRASPCFIEDPKDVGQLIWSPVCLNNLVVYLMDEKRKVMDQEALHKRGRGPEPDRRPVGIVVKGCDSRALVQLIQENIIGREDVYILGIPCNGIIDPAKFEDAWHERKIPVPEDGTEIEDEEGIFRVRDQQFDKDGVLLDKCLECVYHNPVIFDDMLTEEIEGDSPRKEVIDELESMSPGERWEFWKNELSRCIRCYACRSACPLCYCEECAVDPTALAITPFTTAKEKAERPQWIEQSTDLSDNLFFQLTRIFHMIGRCIDCGECERACPMNIPLRKLTHKMAKCARERFNFTPGLELEKKPLFATAEENDPEDVVE